MTTHPRTPDRVLFYGPGETPDGAALQRIIDDVERRRGMADRYLGAAVSFRFTREDGRARVTVVTTPGGAAERTEVPLAHRLVLHSPTGFEFGYAGSGPADTALNILAQYLPAKEAVVWHQEFKTDCVARMEPGEILPESEVLTWIASQYRRGYRPGTGAAAERPAELTADDPTFHPTLHPSVPGAS